MERGNRFEALDILRGLAILGMAWSGMLPDQLPIWMFHAQMPPPGHLFDPSIYGITWVDLVFPVFLFSLGAAAPLALTRRLEQGVPLRRIIFSLGARGLLLAAFAIYGEHLRPFELARSPNTGTWALSLLGFGLLVLMFIRWPDRMPTKFGKAITGGAWLVATVIIATHIYPDGVVGFENTRNDVILMVLANVAVSGGLVWLGTRCTPQVRVGLMAAISLIFLTSDMPGSVGSAIWNWAPTNLFVWQRWSYGRLVPVFYHFEYHKYLLIVIPGLICGDLILRWNDDERVPKSRPRLALYRFLCVATAAIACMGLYARAVTATAAALMVFCGALFWLLWPYRGGFLWACTRWATWLLALGLLAEPLGGGIRKDSPTLSYFFVTAGLSFLLLCACAAAREALGTRFGLGWLRDVGSNPILAYVAITNFAVPVGGLVGWSDWLSSTWVGDHAWVLAVLDGGCKTLLVGAVAVFCTRKRVFLRA